MGNMNTEESTVDTSRATDNNHDDDAPPRDDGDDEDVSSDDSLAPLDPPASCGELLRDFILRTLDRPFFQWLGIIVLMLVIADGAFFFFLLMGWQSLCRPRTDCETRNWWYNWSIQVLNVLFTYMATVAMPWRSANFLHIVGWSCPRRNHTPGHDLYGRPVDDDIWFYVPLRRRLGITVVLLLNCFFQFANQGTRIHYYSFELQDSYPGVLWTNIFFGLSFLCAGIGGAWLAYEVSVLRKQHPTQFGPGPVDSVRSFCSQRFRFEKSNDENDEESLNDANEDENIENEENADEEAPAVDQVASGDHAHHEHRMCASPDHPDPTREPRRRSVVPTDRSCMRMFAM